MKFSNKMKIISAFVFFMCMIQICAYSMEINLITEETEKFNDWINLSENEKEYGQMPDIYSIELPSDIYDLNVKETKNILMTFKQINNKLGSQKAQLDRYSLVEDITVNVKNQENTGQCWAFSTLSVMETNIALTKGIYKDFSERHVAYATAKNFIDGQNESAFNRKVNEYGLQTMALAYLTNGQGAVLEEKMPFENNEEEIYLSQIDIPKDTYVTDYEMLPTIYKTYDNNKNVEYNDGNGINYSKEEVEKIREKIKEHIVKYGAISAVTASTQIQYYNNSTQMYNSTAYYCNDENVVRDHAVTIIGWDDNYSKENFNENCRPSSNGAYIVLNSYSDKIFDNGYLYISYEDALIETSLYGISGTSNDEYYKIYQHDYYGGIANLGTGNRNTGYYANIYTRNSNDNEMLDNVGITVCDYVELNVYVNPNGDDLSNDNLIKVGTTDILTPGYHTIDIKDIELISDKFAIVVEQISENNKFMFSLETYIEGSVYEFVKSEKGNSKVSFDGKTWYDLSDFGTVSFVDTNKSDVCIKAFTKQIDKKEEIEQEKPKDEEIEKEEPEKEKPKDEEIEKEEPEQEKPKDEEIMYSGKLYYHDKRG